jgi:hypothetical protein
MSENVIQLPTGPITADSLKGLLDATQAVINFVNGFSALAPSGLKAEVLAVTGVAQKILDLVKPVADQPWFLDLVNALLAAAHNGTISEKLKKFVTA